MCTDFPACNATSHVLQLKVPDVEKIIQTESETFTLDEHLRHIDDLSSP